MFQEREIQITPQQYICSRSKNKDTRFKQSILHVFASAAYLEEKMMERNIGVSYSKGQVIDKGGSARTYHLEDAFGVLDNVKNTPRYHKKVKWKCLVGWIIFDYSISFTHSLVLTCGGLKLHLHH